MSYKKHNFKLKSRIDLELELDNIRQDAYVSMRIELDEQYGDLQYIDKWPGLSPYKESDIIKSKILNC